MFAQERSYLFHFSPRFAWAVIAASLCAAAAMDLYFAGKVWFGPVYLMIITFTAWTVNCRTAIVIGILILATKVLAGGWSIYPNGAEFLLANIAARFTAIVVVVGFMGLARKSCEREWTLARIDPLTGALNRQAFFEIIQRDHHTDGWAALIYADIDGLKQMNDEQGHAQGDQSLKLFARTVRDAIRKEDLFARIGGDEFIIFMKLKDQEAGKAVAERLHKAINSDAADDPAHLKCSLGVLLLPHGTKSIDAELKAADKLMYTAKTKKYGLSISTAIERDGNIFALPAEQPLEGGDRKSAVRRRKMESEAEAPPTLAGNAELVSRAAS